MLEIQKYRRLLYLYLLGIPIESPYVDILDEMCGYFKKDKLVSIVDFDGDATTCSIKNDRIVYASYMFNKNANDGGYITVKINLPYQEILDSLRNRYPFLDDSVMNDLTFLLLNRENLEYKNFHISKYSEYDNDSHMMRLKKIIDSGKFKILES